MAFSCFFFAYFDNKNALVFKQRYSTWKLFFKIVVKENFLYEQSYLHNKGRKYKIASR